MAEQNLKKVQSYRQSPTYLKCEPDLYLILGDKIYPAHRRFMSSSKYISKKIAQKSKAVIIECEINNQLFQKALYFIYTSSVSLSKSSQQIQDLFEVAHFLHIDSLKQQILEQADDYFEQYSIFSLYKISTKYKIRWLKQRCEEQFISLEYQQFRINRYDLLQTSQGLFQTIIKDHQKLKANKTISGLKIQEIKQIVLEYNLHHNCNLSVDQLIKASHDCFQISQSPSKMALDRKKTLSPPKKKQQIKISKRISKSNSVDGQFSFPDSNQENQKNQNIQDKADYNNQEQKYHCKDHLKQVRDSIFQLEQVQSPVVDIFEFEDKLNLFQKFSGENDDKFLQHKDSYGQISQRSCQQDEAEDSINDKDQQNLKDSKNCICQKNTLPSPIQQIYSNIL